MEPTKMSRLGPCEVCGDNDAKYACPKCEVKTCCLSCVKIHKKELSCSGERDKVAYKPLNKFTNMDLQSDYMLLEEMSRRISVYRRNPEVSDRWHNVQGLPKHLYKLKRAAAGRNIRLEYMPPNFSRHKENTTFLNWRTRIITWHVEWIFPQANNITCTDRVLEEERVAKLVNKYLDPAKCDEMLMEHLQFYQSKGLSGVVLLLKTECPLRFYELDPTSSLKMNLGGKRIVEFPTIYVVMKEHKHVYNVVDSDDEEEVESAMSRRPMLNGHNYKKPLGSIKDSFLFCHSDTDKSDDEQNQNGNHSNSDVMAAF